MGTGCSGFSRLKPIFASHGGGEAGAGAAGGKNKPFPSLGDITGGEEKAIFRSFSGTCSDSDLRRWQQSLLLKLRFETLRILPE